MKPIIWIDQNHVAWDKKPNDFSEPYLNINYLIKSRENEKAMDFIARFLVGYEEDLEKLKKKPN
jgi:hypothetical protein